MKTILMSFWPSVYKRISSQDKLIEFRSKFPDEDTIVYMYVSKPEKKIKGVIHLSKKIDMSNVDSNSNLYKQALHDGYDTSKKFYGMPIISFYKTKELSLETLKSQFPKFVAPQSYILLDNKKELFNFIKKFSTQEDKTIYNNLSFIKK